MIKVGVGVLYFFLSNICYSIVCSPPPFTKRVCPLTHSKTGEAKYKLKSANEAFNLAKYVSIWKLLDNTVLVRFFGATKTEWMPTYDHNSFGETEVRCSQLSTEVLKYKAR